MFNINDRWLVKEHIIPASYPRGFARGVRDEENDRLRLAVKQYVPRANSDPQPGHISFVFAHAVGATKESYEPFFDDLLARFPNVRAVWAADVAWHGASYLLNENVIGDEPHWFDSSRDIVHMVNHFQASMPPPLVGIGQSWGCFNILMASVHHPRLFKAIVAMEPVILTGYGRRPHKQHLAMLMMNRKDKWRSREEARRSLKRNPFYTAFDPRVFEQIMKYDLRDIPLQSSALNDGSESPETPSVTLTTPKSMEVYSMMRANPPIPGYPPGPDHAPNGEGDPVIPGFHRPEVPQAHRNLPSVLPPVIYIWGKRSWLPPVPGYRSSLLDNTGTGPGGSGGAPAGKVSEIWIDCGHSPPLEKPSDTAEALAPWLAEQMQQWKQDREKRKNEPRYWTETINPGWLERVAKL